MFRHRAEVFGRQLGWEVEVKDGRERDRFDDANPIYLISVEPGTGEYRGSLRLLPTTGPNMLRDVFPQLVTEAIESPEIWESSRICVIGRKSVAIELFCGAVEVCALAGVTKIVTVFSEYMLGVFRQAGVQVEIIGSLQPVGGEMTYAALLEPDQEAAAKTRALYGWGDSVLDPKQTVLEF